MFYYTDEDWEKLISEYEEDLKIREDEYQKVIEEYGDN